MGFLPAHPWGRDSLGKNTETTPERSCLVQYLTESLRGLQEVVLPSLCSLPGHPCRCSANAEGTVTRNKKGLLLHPVGTPVYWGRCMSKPS
jgi:hypothetical protein